jgi:hypothetical protein
VAAGAAKRRRERGLDAPSRGMRRHGAGRSLTRRRQPVWIRPILFQGSNLQPNTQRHCYPHCNSSQQRDELLDRQARLPDQRPQRPYPDCCPQVVADGASVTTGPTGVEVVPYDRTTAGGIDPSGRRLPRTVTLTLHEPGEVLLRVTGRVILGGDEVVKDRAARGRVPAGSRVIVREGRDGALRVIYTRCRGSEAECCWTPAAPRAAKPRAEAGQPSARPTPHAQQRPSSDHPWRVRGTLRSLTPV